MKIFNSVKCVAGVSLTAAIVAGCTGSGGSQLSPAGPFASANSARQLTIGNRTMRLDLLAARIVTPNFHKVPHYQQVETNCCARETTAFITDAFGGSANTGAVYMFNYHTGHFLGALSRPPEGWDLVQGACSDSSGHVYFANTVMSTVDEYSHSGKFIAAIAESHEYPEGCAYDESSGDLAISNKLSTTNGEGNIAIAHDGTIIAVDFPPNMLNVYFLGYAGRSGVLYLDGNDIYGNFKYDSFYGGTFTPITITGGSIASPGTVEWSAKTQSMNVGDQDTVYAPTLYQVSSTGAITGSTVTTCSDPLNLCDPVQWAIKKGGMVLPDSFWHAAHRFKYPGGGAFTLNYSGPYFVQATGAAISPPTRRR